MEGCSALETMSLLGYVSWEEVNVSSDRGRREVHYYLKRKDGTSDLAVVGREKSLRHMSYHYAIRDRSLLSISASSSLLKLRSRREVIDWLNSIVPVLDLHPYQSSQPDDGSREAGKASELDLGTLKEVQQWKLGKYTTEFLWIGSMWTCRKRRRHYESFQRNGVKISVHDFVYVLAEEDKRLVAYLDDLYEDSRGNKMVVVRWFHKIDEVGIVLPHNYNDREIFFSLCLQDLSIECIDGLATVLSPQHYEKFLNEAKHTQLEPFVCDRQFDNDDVKPFDITEVKGYWEQELIKYMFTISPSNAYLRCQPPNGLKVEGNCADGVGIRPKKRLRQSGESDTYWQSANKDAKDACLDVQNFSDGLIGGSNSGIECKPIEGCPAAYLSGNDAMMQKHWQHLTIGSEVEVLSQDSGIRGCWFRALIIKKHKDKVKLRYLDIKDAADEINNLEEWMLAFRVAAPDELGIRICGRTTVRPTPLSSKRCASCVVHVGSVVDVWWHDGWWEGIVIRKESENKIHVYFPGEKREHIFGCSDLRPSQEWLGTGWKHINERPELVISIMSDVETVLGVTKSSDSKLDQAGKFDHKELVGIHEDSVPVQYEYRFGNSRVDSEAEEVKDRKTVQDLSKDVLLAQLKWRSSRKRRRGRNSFRKLHCNVRTNKSSSKVLGARVYERFFIPSSLKVDHDNCKYISDSLCSSSVVSPLTSLVMSR